MSCRKPAVAGQFYPSDESKCRREVEALFAQASGASAYSGKVVGGIVPHAGWVCSGAVAAEVIESLARGGEVDTVVVFGAVHQRIAAPAVLQSSGVWQTPLGKIAIDEELARALLGASALFVDHAPSHEHEHSIEVQIPFIQHAWPAAKLLPVMVLPTSSAAEIGRAVATQVGALGRKAIYIGSTDLTHYGPRYRFTPQGVGPAGLNWAKNVNDQRMIDRVLNLETDQILTEASTHHNACGAGAITATLAACQASGAKKTQLLRHTTSSEVLTPTYGPMDDAVGYAGIIFHTE